MSVRPDLSVQADIPLDFSTGISIALRPETGISWGEIAARVMDYWQAVGVSNEDQLTALTRQIMQKLDVMAPAPTKADLTLLAIEEVRRMLDEWLAGLLGLDRQTQSQELAMARVALLSGTVSDWPAVLLGESNPGLIDELRKNMPPAAPETAELAMAAQQIELFTRRWVSRGRRYLRLFRVAMGRLLRFLGMRR